ncbi:MAG: D-alanyl-D-alanine carboxypeptidase, partial [Bdellovibrionota bacterium]
MSKLKASSEILIWGAVLLGTTFSSTLGAAAPTEPALIQNVRKDLRAAGPNSSFCYVEENGAIQGVNPNQPVKIASVMKLLTTLWAVDKYGANHEYVTKIYYQPINGEMHIAGARDPFFDRDRIYLLLSDLNRNKISQLKRLTFDGNFLINKNLFEFAYDPANAKAYKYTEAHADGARGGIGVKESLEDAFNTSKWWAA